MIGRPAILALLAANVLGFLAQNVWGDDLLPFALWPWGPDFHLWQLVTYAFLHGNLMHIGFNMLGLVVFGSDLERIWGSAQFLRYYFVSVIAAGVTQLVVSVLMNNDVPTIGASGGVFGLLLAFAVLFPNRRLILLFPPIPIRARVFAILYAGIELILGVTQTMEGVAHFAHLGGMLGGWLYLLSMRRPRDDLEGGRWPPSAGPEPRG